MLEQPALLLRPWTWEDNHRRRPVLNAATGEPLGFVSRRQSLRWPLLRWLARRILEVYETEDASLLLILRGPPLWSRSWEVLDADERHVGMIRGGALWDRYQDFLAQVELGPDGAAARFVSPAGLELASYRAGSDGVLLQFNPALEGDPFAKMIVLGATLARTEND
jgi:hypothetical protein